MTNQHPITPPPELVQQWHKEACKDPYHGGTFFESKTLKHIATQAAQWGADQELEACCALMDDWGLEASDLRAARRPKPPSLKEQALDALREAESSGCLYVNGRSDTIRKALEALPND